VAFSLVSVRAYLPMYLSTLTQSSLIIGLVPTIQMLGMMIPSMLVSHLIERQPRLRAWQIGTMLLERTPLILIGVWILLAEGLSPRATLAGILVLWTLYAFFGGTATAIWFNLVARVVPPTLRGRLHGLGGGIAAVLGIAIAGLARQLFDRLGAQRGYGVGFIIAGAIIWLGSWAFLAVQESPESHPVRHTSLGTFLRALPAVLRQDHTFAWFLLSRSLWIASASAATFYTLFAITRFGLEPRQVVGLAVAAASGSALGSFGGGYLADRRGNRVVLLLSSAALAMGTTLVAIGWHSAVVVLAMAADGMVQSTGMIGGQNLPIELAPHDQVPRYLAANSTLLGPARVVAPMLAGGLIAIMGYQPVFVLAAVLGVLSGMVLLWRVPEPRKV
jgi:MFS family permease